MRAILTCAALAVSGCAAVDHISLPQTLPRCVAYGATLSMSLPDGKASKGAGCVETGPYPGEPAPPP